jgi:NAD-specific glutamate dehydrogenase
VTDWNIVFLGVIALATLVMATIQVGVIVAVARIARQTQQAMAKAQETLTTAQQAITSVREEIRPLISSASAIAEEASRAATLATAQVHKVDRLVTDLTSRIDETSTLVQHAIITPAREGLAIIAAVRATLGALRAGVDWRRRTSRSEEEDPLFIG